MNFMSPEVCMCGSQQNQKMIIRRWGQVVCEMIDMISCDEVAQNRLNRIIQSDNQLLEIFLLCLLNVGFGFYFFSSQHFISLSGSALLDLALQLLEGFTLGVALGDHTDSSQSEGRLVLHQVLLAVVGEAEPGRSVSSEGSPEPVQHDVLGLPVVLVGDQLTEVLLRNVGLSLVVDVEEELPAGEQLVDSKSAGLDGDGHKIIIFILKINKYFSLLAAHSPNPPAQPPSTNIDFCPLNNNKKSLAYLP